VVGVAGGLYAVGVAGGVKFNSFTVGLHKTAGEDAATMASSSSKEGRMIFFRTFLNIVHINQKWFKRSL
jgi:hypothetical protein